MEKKNIQEMKLEEAKMYAEEIHDIALFTEGINCHINITQEDGETLTYSHGGYVEAHVGMLSTSVQSLCKDILRSSNTPGTLLAISLVLSQALKEAVEDLKKEGIKIDF